MFDGETDQPVETPAGETPPVPSQETPKTPSDPREKTPEEREAAREAYLRRQEHRSWRQKLAASGETSPEAVQETLKRIASDEGFDVSDENNQKQLRLIAKSVHTVAQAERVGRQRILTQASSALLSDTLQGLGYEPSSAEGKTVGQYLFNRFGIDNPDVYSDKEKIESEIERLSKVTSRKKDPVEEALVRKAGGNGGSPESRTPSSEVASKAEMKKYAESRGVSEKKAQKMAELEKKLPVWARRKT